MTVLDLQHLILILLTRAALFAGRALRVHGKRVPSIFRKRNVAATQHRLRH